ncbi:MAG: TonB-dependent receptor [Acidobacteria bacterium]|nr:TonB-dependent receptor [Acidobacteriota bacterium]
MNYSRLHLFLLNTTLIILLNFISVLAISGEITGTIKDESGQIVSNATVLLITRDGRQMSITTGNDGRFSFSNLKTDSYFIKATASGFRSLVSQEIILTNNENKDLDLTLKIFGINEEIVVTAENSSQLVDQTSKSLSTLSQEEIVSRQEYTLAETLSTLPGVRQRSFGGPGSLTSIRLRGLANENTAILIDGLRFRDAGDIRGSSQALQDSLFNDNVQRIELLRGSGSSLYGTNAVGGVINIVPFTGVGRPSGEISFQGSGLGQLRESARIGGSFKNTFSYSFGASRIDTNDGIDGQDIFRSTSFATSLRYLPSSNFSLSGVISYNRSFLQINDSPFPIGPTGNELGYASGSGNITGFITDLDDPDAFRTTRFFQSGFSLRHRVSDIVSYNASFNFVRSNRRFFDGPAASPLLVSLITKAQGFFPRSTSDTLFKGRTYTFNTGVNLRLGKYNLATIGFEAEKERLRQTTDFFGKESFAQKTYGIYFQDQFSYFENRLQLSLASRIQFFTLDFDNLSTIPSGDLANLKNIDIPKAYTGDGSIAYSFFKTGTKLRAHIGNSFRAPALLERFSAFDGTFMPVRIGNPFLRPERAISVDGGIDQSLLKNRLKIGLTYFYTRRQEIISAGFIPFSSSTGAAFFQSNSPGGLSRGAEISVNANPAKGLDVSLAYTYVNSELNFRNILLEAKGTTINPNGQFISGSTRAFGIPRNTFSAVINQRYKQFNINFDLTAISEFDSLFFSPGEFFNGFASRIVRLDGYVKADLGASYTFPLGEKTNLEIFGKVSNLFDEKYFEDGFKTPGAIGTGGIKFRF